MNTPLHKQTITQLNHAIRRGDVSRDAVTHYFAKRIRTYDPKLNSFITTSTPSDPTDKGNAHNQDSASVMNGIPIAHKDIFCVKDTLCTCGSKMLHNFIAPYDATIVSKLNAAGAITLGKTNMDEFAMGSTNESSAYGPVMNPWELGRVAGGSSGGSAAAVAARLVPAATGSDTGGSIRQPASFCGITGIKPTYGRCSRYGMVAYASSLDQAGVLAVSAEDAAIVLGAMVGHDPLDATSSHQATPNFCLTLNDSIKGKRIGIPKDYFDHPSLDSGIANLISNALDTLQNEGAELVEITLPSYEKGLVAYYVIAPSEASSNLSRFDGIRFGYRSQQGDTLSEMIERSRAEGFGTEVKRRIMMGVAATRTEAYHVFYRKAQRIRRIIQQEFLEAFKACDVIASPTVASTAFTLDQHKEDPIALYLSDIFTIPVNLAGLPAMSIPVGFLQGLPVGMQLIGAPFDEAGILNMAHRYQQQTDWHNGIPSWVD